jgi:hypothetical protein
LPMANILSFEPCSDVIIEYMVSIAEDYTQNVVDGADTEGERGISSLSSDQRQ